MSYSLTLYDADGASELQHRQAEQRFRKALDETLGDESLVGPVYTAYLRIIGAYGETPDVEALFGAIRRLETPDETERFFRDLCTLNELHDLSQRWAVVRLLDSGLHYAEISKRTGASTATITRIASWLNHGEGGYRAVLDKSK